MSAARCFALVALGDICLSDLPARATDGSLELWKSVAAADLAIANLEVALTETTLRAEKAVTFRAPPSAAAAMRTLGFGAVSLANNHMMDMGLEGLNDTLRALDASGIAHFGAGPDAAAAWAPTTLELQGVRIGLIGLSCIVPPGAAATDNRPGIAAVRVITSYVHDPLVMEEQPGSPPLVRTQLVEADALRAENAVRSATRSHDLVIVFVHWGVMSLWSVGIQGDLAEYQRPLAYRLAAAGARLVIGSGSHAPGPVETLSSSLLAFDLGDGIFQQLPDTQWSIRPESIFASPAIQRRLAQARRGGLLLSVQLDGQAINNILLRELELDARGSPRLVGQARKYRPFAET